jgi:hypothetical protein
MVFRNSDVTSKGNYGDTPSPGDDPFDKIISQITEIQAELIQEIQEIKDKVKDMLENPKTINVGYLMMLFSNVPDTNTALQAAKTVGVTNVIKEQWSKISSEMAQFAHTEKLNLGPPPTTTIFPENDPNFPNGAVIRGVNSDGTLQVQKLGPDGKPDPLSSPTTYDPFGRDGCLKPGVPFLDMSGCPLTWSGDPRTGTLVATPLGLQPPNYAPLANKMISASKTMHTNTLQDMDDLKKYLDLDKTQLGGVDTITSVLKDNIASFSMTLDPAYTFLAASGALGELGQKDTSRIDDCSTVLSNINSSKNTVETTMNSTVSQSQVQLNQAQGQYQSCMTAVGGSLSTYKDMLSNFISNMRG